MENNVYSMDKKISVYVFKTDDYSKFSFLKENRAIDRLHVNSLKDSISKRNLLEYRPILVNKKYEVMDGQHRLVAAESLNIPIYYMMSKDIVMDDVMLLNPNQKGWFVKDYLNVYVEKQIPEYLEVQKMDHLFSFSISTSIAILGVVDYDNYSGTIRGKLKEFKQGSFYIPNVFDAYRYAENLGKVSVFTDLNTWKDRDFMSALYILYTRNKIKHSDLISKLESYKGILRRRPSVVDYLRQFEDVINYNSKQKIRLS